MPIPKMLVPRVFLLEMLILRVYIEQISIIDVIDSSFSAIKHLKDICNHFKY